METNYLDELNESQRQAVLYCDGPSLVVAGAGSGKTRVLTYKIAYLINNGYEPWNILALTFTNKAAREMKERIAKQVGIEKSHYLWMGTFHSIFARILRIQADAVGFTQNFTIYDAADSKSLIRTILKEKSLDEKLYKPGLVQNRISKAKNQLVLPEDYMNDRELMQEDYDQHVTAMPDIYKEYFARCKQAGVMDFDDLLLYTFLLFKNHPEILDKYKEQFRYILVDEYQDTNYAQHQIVMLLSDREGRLCVVGDDAQSIYSFRGANIDNILDFTRQFDKVTTFKLEQNYRSTKNIVLAANSLIEKNERRIKKTVFSDNAEGDLLRLFSAYSDMEEGEIVGNQINRLVKHDVYGYDDIAILYRTNAQSRIFEEMFRKRAIPYRIYGGLSFYQRKEIKDVIAYFRMAVNPDDEEAFKRIINYPARGIGDTTLNKLASAASNASVSLWTVLNNLSAYELSVNKGTQKKLTDFCEMITRFMQLAGEKNAVTSCMEIVQVSGLMRTDGGTSQEEVDRRENITELMNGVEAFYSERLEEGNEHVLLSDFLADISLLTDQDTDVADEKEHVTLMTVHAAKGLEFPNVFVVGMEEGLFPSQRSASTERELEEERRLFYVAITRAKDHCYLSYAKNRMRYGSMERSVPSCFLGDIDERYICRDDDYKTSYKASAPPKFVSRPVSNTMGMMSDRKSFRPVSTSNLPPTPTSQSLPPGKAVLNEGMHILHERFGEGEVLKVEGTGENMKATINFKNAGIKQLLLRFARYKIV